MPLLDRVEVPTYLGCDWQNVPLHLPSTFPAMRALVNASVVRVGMLGEFGLTWPWESLHIEALAWFDHWLKGQDTGILEGPAIRYWMPGADEWRTSDVWPPAESEPRVLSLRADGELADDEGEPGERSLMVLDAGLRRSGSSDADPPSQLVWTSAALGQALDVVGDIELELHASATALDTAWIVTVQAVAPDNTVEDVTAGWLRASRRVDPSASSNGSLELPCREGRDRGPWCDHHLPDPACQQRATVRGPAPGSLRADQRRPGRDHSRDHGVRTRAGGHQPQHHPLLIEALLAMAGGRDPWAEGRAALAEA